MSDSRRLWLKRITALRSKQALQSADRQRAQRRLVELKKGIAAPVVGHSGHRPRLRHA